MPVYSYKCKKCDYSCKIFHGINETAGKCPTCSSDEFFKQLNGSTLTIINTNDTPKQRVEKFIEETRVAVAEQIAEARKELK